jgi:proteasome lid subunit RPN8/RPN11
MGVIEYLQLRPDHWGRMRAHVEACVPLEACGLLAGKGNSVDEVLPITNQARSPMQFRMDPAEQIRAFGHMEARGMDLVAIYHSHPAEPGTIPTANPEPSDTDIAEAAYPAVYIVWSRPTGQWRARGFWIEGGRLSEVELHIEDGP